MNLIEFSSPLPKPWLNINANSVNVGSGGASAPVSTCLYSQTSTVAVANFLGSASLTAGSTSVGSLTLPPLPVGATVRLKAHLRMQIVAAPPTTADLRLDIDGAAISFLTYTGAADHNGLIFEGTFVVRPGGLAVANISTLSLGGSNVTQTTVPAVAYNNAISHALDLVINYSAAAPGNAAVADMVYVELLRGS